MFFFEAAGDKGKLVPKYVGDVPEIRSSRAPVAPPLRTILETLKSITGSLNVNVTVVVASFVMLLEVGMVATGPT